MTILDQKIGKKLAQFEEIILNGRKGLKTYFPSIDKQIGAMPGLVQLIGDPKAGKSTWLMNVILRNALHGHPVILYDQENGLQRTQTRMLCCLAGLPREAIETQKFVLDEKERYEAAKQKLAELPIYYISQLDFHDLEEYIREVGKEHGEHVLVCIDSLNRLTKDYDNRRGDVDKWMNHFNMLKTKYDKFLTLIFVAEKGQQDIGNANAGKAKESSTIPYLAEMVFNIYRKEGEQVSGISCTYNRDGPTGLLAKLESGNPYTYELHEVAYLPEL